MPAAPTQPAGDDLAEALRDAWTRIRPLLDADPHELARRLARRRQPLLQRPPRAWCLAIRASDLRINPSTAYLHPDEDPGLGQPGSLPTATDDPRPSPCHRLTLSLGHPPPRPASQRLTLYPPALRKLVSPVTIDWPGQPYDDVAKKLGVHPAALTAARCKGVFRHKYVAGLAARRGKPVPMLYTEQPLDPASRLFAKPDPAWLWTATHLNASIRDDFPPATLTRVPAFRPISGVFRRLAQTHPELDGSCYIPRPSYALPPPPPDPVWYKWTKGGDTYLGDNPQFWRKSPQDPGIPPGDPRRAAADAEFEKHRERRRARIREYGRQRPSRSSGSEVFDGWHWLCPACGRRCRTIYCPLRPRVDILWPLPRLATMVDIPPWHGRPRPCPAAASRSAGIEEPPERQTTGEAARATGFACHRCHQIKYFSRCARGSWNHLIAHLTAGLLYGREVPRPAWLSPDRKRDYQPRPGRAPSKTRERILARIKNGWTFAQIAADLHLTRATLRSQCHVLYRSHGVHNRAALAARFGCLARQPLPRARFGAAEILPHLLAGRSFQEISTLTGVNPPSVHSAATRAYRRHGVTTREDFARLTHSPLPTPHTRPSPRRDEVMRRLLAGQSYHQIALAMGITPSGVGVVANKIYRLHGVHSRRELRAIVKTSAVH